MPVTLLPSACWYLKCMVKLLFHRNIIGCCLTVLVTASRARATPCNASVSVSLLMLACPAPLPHVSCVLLSYSKRVVLKGGRGVSERRSERGRPRRDGKGGCTETPPSCVLSRPERALAAKRKLFDFLSVLPRPRVRAQRLDVLNWLLPLGNLLGRL